MTSSACSAKERRWLKAYRDQPQCDEELEVTEAALESLAEYAWDIHADRDDHEDQDALVERHAGSLTGTYPSRYLEELRLEWR